MTVLKHRVSVVVPSKRKDGEPVAESVRRVILNHVCRKLAAWAGGYSMFDGRGGWLDEAGSLHEEAITEVVSYASDEAFLAGEGGIAIVQRLARDVKSACEQLSVSYTVDGVMYIE